jgi:hypothetical protein
MWYLYTMEFWLTKKKSEILSFAGKWMELENIISSEVSQVQKVNSHMSSLMCVHPIQLKQYYEKQVILRGGHIKKGRVKEGS